MKIDSAPVIIMVSIVVARWAKEEHVILGQLGDERRKRERGGDPYLSVFKLPGNWSVLRPLDDGLFWSGRKVSLFRTVSCDFQLLVELSEPCRSGCSCSRTGMTGPRGGRISPSGA